MRLRIPEDIPDNFDNERAFGIEFEITTPNNGNPDSSFREAVSSQVTGSEIPEAWTIKGDCSIYGSNPFEFTTPALKGLRGLCELTKGIEWLSKNAKINKTCGLHIHHNAKDLGEDGLENLYLTYLISQSLINEIIPPSRRNNNYCLDLTRDRNLSSTKAALKNKRYPKSRTLSYIGRQALSFGRWSCRGTVEFRQHSGTVNRSKVLAWLFFTHAMVNYSKHNQITKPPKDIATLCEILHLPQHIAEFFEGRHEIIKTREDRI